MVEKRYKKTKTLWNEIEKKWKFISIHLRARFIQYDVFTDHRPTAADNPPTLSFFSTLTDID